MSLPDTRMVHYTMAMVDLSSEINKLLREAYREGITILPNAMEQSVDGPFFLSATMVRYGSQDSAALQNTKECLSPIPPAYPLATYPEPTVGP